MPLDKPALPSGNFDQFSIGQVIAHYLPENAIVSDEAATNGIGAAIATAKADPHDHLSLTGGSIGQGLPLATGAAVACPDRKVVCLHGDGGAMYTLQALWTQAREKLDVTTVIFANRSYAILNVELARVGAANPGPRALSMLDLHNPGTRFRLAGARHGRRSHPRRDHRGIHGAIRLRHGGQGPAPDRGGAVAALEGDAP